MVGMDRRGFMIAAGAMLATPVCAHAAQSWAIDGYYDRLRQRLGDSGGGRFNPAVEDALLSEHNDFRLRQGLSRLVRDSGLDAAAKAHAADMGLRDYFEHVSPEGFASTERVALLARRFVGLAGENIVEVRGGPPSHAEEMAQMWRTSPGHRANMLRPAYTHVGFAALRMEQRSIGVAVFAVQYAELPAPLAYRIGDGSDLARLLEAAGPSLAGYALNPIGGGPPAGPFWVEDPSPAPSRPGVYAIAPYLIDPAAPRRFLIVNGPIVQAG